MAEYIVEKKGNKIKENTGTITIGPFTTTIDFIDKQAVEIENPFLLFFSRLRSRLAKNRRKYPYKNRI